MKDIKYEKIQIPFIADRLIGISSLQDEECIIISYEGTHRLDLKTQEVENDYSTPEGGENFDEKQCAFNINGTNLEIHGLYGKNELLSSPDGYQLINNQKAESLELIFDNKTKWKFKYSDLSGDWYYLSFSKDYKKIIFLLPYDLFIFEKQRMD